jgi:hypothetical protein
MRGRDVVAASNFDHVPSRLGIDSSQLDLTNDTILLGGLQFADLCEVQQPTAGMDTNQHSQGATDYRRSLHVFEPTAIGATGPQTLSLGFVTIPPGSHNLLY